MKRPSIARDIMVRNLITVSPSTPVSKGIALLLGNQITAAPVVDADRRYLGMLSERCCLSVLSIVAGLAAESGMKTPIVRARDIMAYKLITVSPSTDIMEAIELLLKHRISGAPVIDEDGSFRGVISEKFCMTALLSFAYDQRPSARVEPFMNKDRGRIIVPELSLRGVAGKFLATRYRRLPVLNGEKVVGQVSRRDVLRGAKHLIPILENPLTTLNVDKSIELSDEVRSSVASSLGTGDAATFMDVNARTITEEVDLLSIASIFLETNYRRLPVLRDGKLMGQLSRRDVLKALHGELAAAKRPEQALLYLSATDGKPPSITR